MNICFDVRHKFECKVPIQLHTYMIGLLDLYMKFLYSFWHFFSFFQWALSKLSIILKKLPVEVCLFSMRALSTPVYRTSHPHRHLLIIRRISVTRYINCFETMIIFINIFWNWFKTIHDRVWSATSHLGHQCRSLLDQLSIILVPLSVRLDLSFPVASEHSSNDWK